MNLRLRELAMMNWRSPAFFAATVFVATLLIAGGVYLSRKDRKVSLQQENKQISVRSPSSVVDQPPIEWNTYRVEEYNFQIHYPPDLTLAPKVASPSLPYPTRHVINLYTARVNFEDQISVPFTIAVYDKPSTLSVIQWLSKAYETDLVNVARGNIKEALNRAYAGKTGVVSYREFQERNSTVYEVGEVPAPVTLSYTAYFVGETLPYVYEISLLLLQFVENEEGVEPPDRMYTELFNQIVSTFEFLD